MTTPIQVLILEDRVADAELVLQELRKAGFEPDWKRVDSLRDFQNHLTSNLDLILADYTLPGFTAVDALKILRDTRIDVPLIVVSGSVGEQKAIECLKLGAADYLLKDRTARLGEAVRRALADKDREAEARLAQQALAASERQLRRILSTVEDVVWSFSLADGRMLYVNPAIERLTGRTPQSFLDDPKLWSAIIHVEDRAKELKAREEAKRWGAFDERYRIVRPDGEVRHVSARGWTGSPGDSASGRIEGFVTDITARVIAEDERRQAEAARQEAQRLAQLNEFKTQFMATVTHDVNNSLTPIRINLKMIRDEFARLGQPASKPLTALSASIGRLETFMADLLDAARSQSGKLQLSISDFDAAAALQSVLAGHEAQAKQEGLGLVVDSPTSLAARGDRRRIEQVMENLVGNAIKFTPKGGTVSVQLAEGPQSLRLTVSDTGRGLAKDDISKLFQPFSRIGAVPQGKHSGTGLGLFICKTVVEQHGGQIQGTSAGPGQGTTFEVLLPLHPPNREDQVKPVERM